MKLLRLVAIVMTFAGASLAELHPFTVEVPIESTAINGPGGDPALSGYRCFDLCVRVDGGFRFVVGNMLSDVAPGSFYAPIRGGDIPPDEVDLEEYPNLAYDTYLNVPAYALGAPISIPGRHFGVGAPLLPRHNAQTNLVNVAWGQLGGPWPQGEFQIARLTINALATGHFQGFVTGFEGQAHRTTYFVADVQSGAISALRISTRTGRNAFLYVLYGQSLATMAGPKELVVNNLAPTTSSHCEHNMLRLA